MEGARLKLDSRALSSQGNARGSDGEKSQKSRPEQCGQQVYPPGISFLPKFVLHFSHELVLDRLFGRTANLRLKLKFERTRHEIGQRVSPDHNRGDSEHDRYDSH